MMENSESVSKKRIMKKGGPYSKKETIIRREKVAELHFEKGYTVVTISRMLNVNRNTVTNDIKHCFVKLREEFKDFDIDTSYIVQRNRMETQRRRLIELLEKQLDLKQQLSVEKLIADIENKMIQTTLKVVTTLEVIEKLAVLLFNRWAKNQQPTFRGITPNSIRRLSVEAHEKISKIMEEDEKKTRGYTL